MGVLILYERLMSYVALSNLRFAVAHADVANFVYLMSPLMIHVRNKVSHVALLILEV